MQVPPEYVMHWAENIPVYTFPKKEARVTVWAGELHGLQGLAPPANSWASQTGSDVAVWHVVAQPGAAFQLPAAKGGAGTNRSLYLIEGGGFSINGKRVATGSMAQVRGDADLDLVNLDSAGVSEFLLLQGKPIGEPVAQYGPFVMNSGDEISQAFADYRRTRFGGWPWPRDDPVFPREKGRFSIPKKGAKEELPPSAAAGAGAGAGAGDESKKE